MAREKPISMLDFVPVITIDLLHDSEGFEPGQDAKFNTVKDFIEDRSKRPDFSERLHSSCHLVGDLPFTSIDPLQDTFSLGFVSQYYRSLVIVWQNWSGANHRNGTWER
ncbi:hypothetical protein V8E52_008221 [Russula decolorans]|jgi:hypothetical protein